LRSLRKESTWMKW